MSLLSLLVLTGGLATAFNIAALGIGAAMVGKWPQTVIIRLCLLAAAGATACFLISLENFGLLPKTAPLVHTEIVLTLAAGPLLFLVLSALAGTDSGLRRLAVVVALTLVGFTLTEIMTGSADIRHAVLVQMGWTLFAAWHVRHAVRGQGRGPLFTRMLRALLLAMVIIHLAQILRMSFPDVAMMRAALPLGFALAFVLGAMMAALVPVRDGRARLTPPATAGLSVAEIRLALTSSADYLRRDYRLADLATQLDRTPQQISATINRSRQGGFIRLLNRARLKVACDIMQQPEEAQTSIEAIALGVGFASRSAFYRAFVQEYGQTPGAYRKQATNMS